MQGVIHSFILYWRIAYGKKWTLFILLLSFFYNLYFFYIYIVIDKDPAEALVRSSFIVQGGILASMMIGIYLSKLEEKVGLEELIETFDKARLRQDIGKVLFFLSFLTLYLLINILALIIMFSITQVALSPFYVQSALYIILYWGLSFIIGSLLGATLSVWIKGRLIYVVSLVIWLCISPMNYPILSQLAILLHSPKIFETINFLNIGQHDPHQPYYIFYGFSLEKYQWLKRSFFTFILLVILLGSLLCKKKLSKAYISIFTVLVIITSYIGFELLGKQHQVLRSGSAKDGILNQDSSYYKKLILKETQFNHYQIMKYQIDLDIRNALKANVVIEVMNPTKNKMDTFDFLLYHDLVVSEILDSEGYSVEFTQHQDIVQIKTNQSLNTNETNQFTFKYEGVSSPFFFANHRAINLLNHFPWLPTNSRFNLAMTEIDFEIFRLPNQSNHEIDYKVKLKGNPNIYTNLDKVDTNKWEGTSSDGIYLVAGSIGEKKMGEKSIIYPYTWEKMLTGFSLFEQFIQGKIDQINEELQLNRTIHLERYMFIDHALNSDMIEQKIWIFDDSIIISPTGLLYKIENGLEINIDFLTYGIVPAMTWKYDQIFTKNIDELRLFDITYAYFLNNRGAEEDKRKYSNFNSFDFMLGHDFELVAEARKLKEYVEDIQVPVEQKITFFREWYLKIKEGGKND